MKKIDYVVVGGVRHEVDTSAVLSVSGQAWVLCGTVQVSFPLKHNVTLSDMICAECRRVSAAFGGLDQANMETVNHPKHYNQHPSGVECITIVEHFTLNVGNAVKYAWRAGLKVPEGAPDSRAAQIEDLRKARWYIDREIGRLCK